LDPDPHGFALIGVAGSGFGSRKAKMTHKNFRSKEIPCSEELDIFRAEDFSCCLVVLYEGLGIS
jgi:hypothetical protein